MYSKIFRRIYESSIAENPSLRFTFMDLLVLADRDGIVDMTHEAIARITNRPLPEIRETIALLEGPDPKSRSPEESGARIRRMDQHRDWGWVIINYDRFHDMAIEEDRRAATRERVKRYRAKSRNPSISEEKPKCNAPVTQHNATVTPASVSVSVYREGNRGVGEGVGEAIHEGVFELQKKIGSAFPNHGKWTHLEERALVDVFHREGAFEEWDKVLRFKESVPAARKQVEGVATIRQLLEHWTDILDKVNGGYNPSGLDRKTSESDRQIREANEKYCRSLDRLMRPLPNPDL